MNDSPAKSTAITSHVFALCVIICASMLLGLLYAAYTPTWQNPDEPAHYNYVKHLAENASFPVLDYGDYPAGYLEEIKAAKFPPHMSIEPIRYESHQPPLYYLLAVPVYLGFGGALLPLRLISVLLGAVTLAAVYRIGRDLFPERRGVALTAAGLAAFLPMRLAVTASVGNDELANLLLTLSALLVARLLTGLPPFSRKDDGKKGLLVLGIIIGLGLVTKTTTYVSIPLAAAVLLCRYSRGARRLAADALAVFGPALLIAAPWYARNVAVYGWPDLLGLIRHDDIMSGQLRTADFIASVGPVSYLREFASTSFRSFWGQFGWMGVLLDSRIYLALGLFSVVMLVGFLLWLAEARHNRRVVMLPGAHLLLVALTYAWYNTQFVQFQGRYLFPAIAPLAVFASLGLVTALRRERAPWMWSVCLLWGAAASLAGLRWGGVDKWAAAIGAAGAAIFVARRFAPRGIEGRVEGLGPAILLALMAVLDLVCLFGFVVPYLQS